MSDQERDEYPPSLCSSNQRNSVEIDFTIGGSGGGGGGGCSVDEEGSQIELSSRRRGTSNMCCVGVDGNVMTKNQDCRF